MTAPTSSYDLLFEPVRLGPVTAPNRFYQVPHCNGMGYRLPQSLAAMRGVKAEGGWGVVCTEEVEIHHSSDLAPYFEGRLWDAADRPSLELMVAAVHAHGALAAVELVHNGVDAPNYYSRSVPIGPRSMSIVGGSGYESMQCRRMDKRDIANVRRWHRAAALRAQAAGFDIVYCYAGHGLSLFMQFMMRRYNDRTDEYGGSLENRVRLLREVLSETRDAIGASCAVAVRLAVEEFLGPDGIVAAEEGRDIVAMLAELPDLWDVNVAGWSNDSASSRFSGEGFQEDSIAFVKQVTTKPVVGVGRYTSPDAMVAAVRRGVVDMIGAARPSIADPFLPNKIRQGRIDDIRECIGCNICVMAENKCIPIRCTQNPTMGEEWRRGWHPEQIARAHAKQSVLIVGAGPAGLECARALGQRGYDVVLAEAARELGGRVAREAALPGLQEYRRVADWRIGQIRKMHNVAIYLDSVVTADDVREFGADHVVIATGARYRRDGIGRSHWRPIGNARPEATFTPDDIMAGRMPGGRVLVFDDDHYYIGGVIAEKLARGGCAVTLATPAPLVSWWAQFTLEQARIQARLAELQVNLVAQTSLCAIGAAAATLQSKVNGAIQDLVCDAVVLVTDRVPSDELYQALCTERESTSPGSTLSVLGDAEAPGIIAQAVFAGHRYARELGEPDRGDATPFRIERMGDR